MKFIELRRLCNTRFYSLVIYGDEIVHHTDIDVDENWGKQELARVAQAEVVRFAPYITDDDAPGLEVELNV